MNYYRTNPWGLQILRFFLLFLIMGFFGFMMVYSLFPKFTGFDMRLLESVNEHSPASLIRASLIVQGILSTFMFAVPALLFAYLTHPAPAAYVGLRAPGRKIQLPLVILVMLGATPVLQVIEGLISHINFGPGVKAQQTANEALMNAFLSMPSFASFIRAFIIMAIVPAVGEELFFRGVLMRLARKRSRNMVFPICFSALIFAVVHGNYYGFVSIFLAGVLLAVIYNVTGSLWCSIAAHLFFNGLQVTLTYLGNTYASVKAFADNNTTPYYAVIGGAILFALSFYQLWKNKTPLPVNWTDDFEKETGDWDFDKPTI